jgi:CheY-like chemotaxis protein
MKNLDKILYVEDDQDIQAIAVMVLETISGFTVQACSSGNDAITKAEAFDPDLVLLDVMMPGMDGPETLHALRKIPNLMNTPVVFMTAKVQPQEVQGYLDIGALGVIAKPFDPMTLVDQLQEIWEKSQLV